MEILKNIPIPKKVRKNKLPLNIMEVGDCFIYKTTTDINSITAARSLCIINSKQVKKFEWHIVEDKIMIWRTS